jgi:spore germination cell wall hydrolase CwlJ-like protein
MLLTIKTKLTITAMLFLAIVAIPLPTQVIAEMPIITANLKKIDKQQVACMAKNIFYEAGSESKPGQAAVARVVLNRVNHGFAETPCKVIYQKTVVNENVICQFSWVCEEKDVLNKASARYKQAEMIAYQTMMGMYKDVVPKTTVFFHSINVDPAWPYKQVARIGNHIFYSKQKVKNEQKPDKK